MALRNGQKIATKLKQLPYYSEHFVVGKTRNLSAKKSESLVIASESSSRLQLSNAVPFFKFDEKFLVADERGVRKLVRGEGRKFLVERKSVKTPRIPRSSRKACQRLKMLMQIKCSTPRTIAKTIARLDEKYQEILACPLDVPVFRTLDANFYRFQRERF